MANNEFRFIGTSYNFVGRQTLDKLHIFTETMKVTATKTLSYDDLIISLCLYQTIGNFSTYLKL